RPAAVRHQATRGMPTMAVWKKVALAALLADGKIDDNEVKVLKKELYADRKIDKEKVKFLIELRNTEQKKAKWAAVNTKLEQSFFQAIQDNVLDNGVISTREARWLREMLYADKKIDANEKKFLTRLKKAAKKTSPEFDALYAECLKK